jgi:hypothetical protein
VVEQHAAGAEPVDHLDEETFQAVYGIWDPLEPAQVAALLEGSGVRWFIAGGRAARVGAVPRRHSDTDVVVLLADLAALRRHLREWHLWEAHEGTLRPLLVGDELRAGREQLWLRQDATAPWTADLLLQSGEAEWVFKKDDAVRLSWEEALHVVDGLPYLRPEVALLHKAHLDRPKDRADLLAAALTAQGREWLIETLTVLGHFRWAEAARATGGSGPETGTGTGTGP